MEPHNAEGKNAAKGNGGKALMRARLDQALVKNGGVTHSAKRSAQREQEDVTRGKQPRTGKKARTEPEAAEGTEHSMWLRKAPPEDTHAHVVSQSNAVRAAWYANNSATGYNDALQDEARNAWKARKAQLAAHHKANPRPALSKAERRAKQHSLNNVVVSVWPPNVTLYYITILDGIMLSRSKFPPYETL